jgi:uncharacterized protein (DUF302 family)
MSARGLVAAAGLAAALAAGPVVADGEHVVLYESEYDFEETAFGVEQAIVGRGLVVDYVSHVGDMLNRTAADVGADVRLFDAANIYLFCSAVLSRKVMEADPMNIAHCPYGVFVAARGDGEETTLVGYRRYPAGEMQEVQSLLDEIAREAAGLD